MAKYYKPSGDKRRNIRKHAPLMDMSPYPTMGYDSSGAPVLPQSPLGAFPDDPMAAAMAAQADSIGQPMGPGIGPHDAGGTADEYRQWMSLSDQQKDEKIRNGEINEFKLAMFAQQAALEEAGGWQGLPSNQGWDQPQSQPSAPPAPADPEELRRIREQSANLDNILAGQEAGLTLSDMMNPQGMEMGPRSTGSTPWEPKDNAPYENPVWYPDSGMSSGNEEGINKVRDMVLDEANDPNQGNRVLIKESGDGPGTTEKRTIRGKTAGHRTGTVTDQSSPDFGAQYDMDKWRYDPEIKRVVPREGSTGIGPGEGVSPGPSPGSAPGPGGMGPVPGMGPGSAGGGSVPGGGMGGMGGAPDAGSGTGEGSLPDVMIPEASPLPGPNRGMPPMAPPQGMPPSQARPMPAPMPMDVPPMDGMTPPMPPMQPRPLPPQANTLPPAEMPEEYPQPPAPVPPRQQGNIPPIAPLGQPDVMIPEAPPLPGPNRGMPLPQGQEADAPINTPGELEQTLPEIEKAPPGADTSGEGGMIGGRPAKPGEQVFGTGPSDEKKPIPPLPPLVNPNPAEGWLEPAKEFHRNFFDELIGPDQRKAFESLIDALLGSNNPQERDAVDQQVASVLMGGAPIQTNDLSMSPKQRQAMQKLDINNDGVVTQEDIFGLPTMRIADVTNPDNPRVPQGDILNKLRAYRQQMG
tara:strand:+ start:6954 stop:9020 length:2067 start_codon:yes stop_codon:yes gene_type:complete